MPNRPRTVSLLPSATEILGHVGGLDRLVGRSHECDYPAEVLTRPALTGPATPAASPAEIDRAVRDRLGAGEPLYTLDTDALAALRPEVILTQDLCRVCSIDLATVRRVAEALDPPPRIVSLNPTTVEEVLEDHLTVGCAVGLEREALAAVVALRERLFRAADHANPYADGPSVAFLEWTDPLYIGGHWTPQLVERAGARHPLNPAVNVDASAGAAAGPQQAFRRAGPSVRVPPEVLAASRPDALIIAPCGVGLDGARRMAEALSHASWWRDLPAVRAGRVAVVDGNQMFNRPGPRLVDAFEWLVGWLHDVPELIPPGFPWSPFDA